VAIDFIRWETAAFDYRELAIYIIDSMGSADPGATYGVVGGLVLGPIHDFRRHGGDHDD